MYTKSEWRDLICRALNSKEAIERACNETGLNAATVYAMRSGSRPPCGRMKIWVIKSDKSANMKMALMSAIDELSYDILAFYTGSATLDCESGIKPPAEFNCENWNEDTSLDDLCKVITTCCIEKDESAAELAKKLKVSRSAVSQASKGRLGNRLGVSKIAEMVALLEWEVTTEILVCMVRRKDFKYSVKLIIKELNEQHKAREKWKKLG